MQAVADWTVSTLIKVIRIRPPSLGKHSPDPSQLQYLIAWFLLSSGENSISRSPSRCGGCIILYWSNRAFTRFPQIKICFKLLNVKFSLTPVSCCYRLCQETFCSSTPRSHTAAHSSLENVEHSISLNLAACDKIVHLAVLNCVISVPLDLFLTATFPLHKLNIQYCADSKEGSADICLRLFCFSIDHWPPTQRPPSVNQWLDLCLLFIFLTLLLLMQGETVFGDTPENSSEYVVYTNLWYLLSKTVSGDELTYQ